MRFHSPRVAAAISLLLSNLAGRDALAFTRSVSFSQRASKWALGSSTEDTAATGDAASSDIPAASSLVPIPITDDTIEFSSGVVGGAIGLAVGGPILGGVTAALANYASKKEDDPGEIVRAVARTAVEIYNFLAELDAKYAISEKGRQSLKSAVDWVKSREGVDAAAVEKIEKALAGTVATIQDLNDEYDFKEATFSLFEAVGDLVEESVKAISSVNKEYQLSDRAMSSLKEAVEKTKAKEK